MPDCPETNGLSPTNMDSFIQTSYMDSIFTDTLIYKTSESATS